MDSSPDTNEVIEQNTLTPSQHPKLVVIKKEVSDEDQTHKLDQYDDYDFEPFHENIFRTLSANFDNTKNIDQVNEACEKLENCFIENSIFNKNSTSKITLKGPASSTVFLKYRDIDDAFIDMIISESNVKRKSSNYSPKKIDLKPFNDSFFSTDLNDPPLSDNEEAKFKNGDSDSEGIEEYESHIDGTQSDNDVSDGETSAFVDEIDDMLGENNVSFNANSSEVRAVSVSEILNEKLHDTSSLVEQCGRNSDLNVEKSFDSSLKETIRDVRVVVKKLTDISDQCIVIDDSDDELTLQTESPPKLPSKTNKQTARKRTGGVVINNTQDTEINSERDDAVIKDSSSKEEVIVPKVFDKMTRAGKRDLERVLKESTANLVRQKTAKIITEKFKELHPEDKDSEISSSEDEDKVLEIQKTAEIVTNTIIAFLKKTKSKKIDKLGKDITEEIANKINNFKFGNESTEKMEEPTSTQALASPAEIVPPSDDAEQTIENKSVKSDDEVEEIIPRRVTREISRLKAQKSKSPKKSSTSTTRKTLAEQFEEIERVEKDIINCELSTSLNLDEDYDEPRRPETRQSKQKQQHESEKGQSENVPSLEVKRRSAPKRKSTSKSKKKGSGKNVSKTKMSALDNKDPITDEQLIDGQFLIDTELNEDSILCLSDSDLIKSKNTESFPFTDSIILKASADSTTSENIPIGNEICTNDVSSSAEELLLISNPSLIENSTEIELDISGMNRSSKSVCENANSQIEDNQKEEDCQSNCLKEANLTKTQKDTNLENGKNDSELIPAKDLKIIVNSLENKENVQVQEVSKADEDKYEVESVKLKASPEIKPPCEQQENYELDKSSNSQGVVDTSITSQCADDISNSQDPVDPSFIPQCAIDTSSSYQCAFDTSFNSQEKLVQMVENKEFASSGHLSVEDSESNQSATEPFKVLNDMITDIEKNILQDEAEIKPKSEKQLISKSESILVPTKVDSPKTHIKESSSQSTEDFADNASFLNYSIDDSFKLMIDEGHPEDDLMEKDMELDTSLESNGNNDLTNVNTENNKKLETVIEKGEDKKGEPVIDRTDNDKKGEPVIDRTDDDKKGEPVIDRTDDDKKGEPVIDRTEKKTESQVLIKASLSKPLTNEEKIAQLTKRDPRLVNDKKIVKVLMRDPRIRNKLPQVEEREKQKKPVVPEPVILESPKSPDPEPVKPKEVPPLKPIPNTVVVSEEKEPILLESTKPAIPDASNEAFRRKKPKKKVDEELLYKTPLSDLHETNNDRPTYDRSKKRRNFPPGKGREVEEIRPVPSRRNRPQEEFNKEGPSYNHHQESNSIAERNYNRESYEDRNFIPCNNEEGVRRPEGQYYGGKFEDRNFNQKERDFVHGQRDDFEQEGYVRRMRTEEHFNAAQDRNDFSDNHIYSRREFYRRNKYAHDHDHFSNSSRLMETRQENQFFSQPNNFAAPAESPFHISAYPPVSLLPDPMYSQEEDFDQSFGNMDTDSFSPPSSDLCPPPPLIRSPSPEMLRRDNYCPSPPRIGRGSPNEREFEEYNRAFHRNYERDERSFRGRNHFNRDSGNSRGYRGGGGSNYRRGKGRDTRWPEDSPPRKRFASEYQRGRDDRGGGGSGRWRRSPSWSPERLGRWSRERSLSPRLHEPQPWDSPRTPSPPRWRDNYRDRISRYN